MFKFRDYIINYLFLHQSRETIKIQHEIADY